MIYRFTFLFQKKDKLMGDQNSPSNTMGNIGEPNYFKNMFLAHFTGLNGDN